MFSNSAFTGTRVPLNTHAPLTRSGVRSTARQVFQSSMDKQSGEGAVFTTFFIHLVPRLQPDDRVELQDMRNS